MYVYLVKKEIFRYYKIILTKRKRRGTFVMAEFISDYFNKNFDSAGVFDAVMDSDSHYFINVIRLKDAKTPEFAESYKKINLYFREIALLLSHAKEKSLHDRFYREALRKFAFSEVNGINLGFSETRYGAAFGDVLRKATISDAFDIIKAGTTQPELFHLVGLFEENVGPDRLSDMIATIIKEDIRTYTRRINSDLGITPENYPTDRFINGIVYNPYKNCELLLLPKEILHELPIAKCWDDIDRVVSENDAIRQEINEIIGIEWRKYTSHEKKAYLKKMIFMDPEKCARVLQSYQDSHVGECNWEADLDYVAQRIFKGLKDIGFAFLQHGAEPSRICSREAVRHVIEIFKDWVENNRGWSEIQEISTGKREKIVQRLIHLGAKEYIAVNNLDISFESDSGRGPVDMKISIGSDRSICEVKLSSNPQYLHGYQAQVQEYGKAECSENLFYVFVDTGNPRRLQAITAEHEKNKQSGIKCPELIIIDANIKKSASIS